MSEHTGLGFLGERRQLPHAYQVATDEARSLLEGSSEDRDFEGRAREIREILDLALDQKGSKAEAVVRIGRLLRTDPLTDQEAGVIVRFQRLLGDNYGRLLERDPELGLTYDELLTIQAGDFRNVERVLKVGGRKTIWDEANKLVVRGFGNETVYRGMRLNDEEAELIRRYGIAPTGLTEHHTLEQLIDSTLWTWGILDKTDEARVGQLRELFFSKVNVLLDVYQAFEFGGTSNWKLGISTTTGENLRRSRGGFFGDHIVEIRLPRQRLIFHKNAGDHEDERTVMFYIPPEAIMGIYPIEDSAYKSTFQLMEESKEKNDKR